MKSTRKKSVIVVLELEEHEAIWLKGLCQNFIGSDKELKSDQKIRRDLFNELDKAVISH